MTGLPGCPVMLRQLGVLCCLPLVILCVQLLKESQSSCVLRGCRFATWFGGTVLVGVDLLHGPCSLVVADWKHSEQMDSYELALARQPFIFFWVHRYAPSVEGPMLHFHQLLHKDLLQ